MIQIKSVVFDLGNVLIDWDPRYLYRKLFQTDDKVEWFLENICDFDWNLKHDSGQLFSKGILEKSKEFPDYCELINAWYQRWEEMLGGPIDESVKVLSELKEKGVLSTPQHSIPNIESSNFINLGQGWIIKSIFHEIF